MPAAGTLAIDLGSTTTVVAFQPADGGPAQLLAVPPFSTAEPLVIPSLIWCHSPTGDQALIGRQVIDAGLLERPSGSLHRDFKRLIGAPPSAGRTSTPLSPEAAGQLLLQRIWQHLPADIQPQRLVLTAPIDGYRGYRSWLMQACQELAVPEVALVDEPTAAAIGAGLPPGSRVLVVDLGGGTIDLSLVSLQGGEGRSAPMAQLLRFAGRDLDASRQALRTAEVLGKAGAALGGRDIDRWIAALLEPDQPDPPAALLTACEQLKCQLSSQTEAMAVWTPAAGAPARALQLQRRQLEALLEEQGLLQLLDGLLERVLASARAAGVQLQDVDAVLPVGGCSRLPLIRQWLEQRTARPLRGERPVEAVALGALSLTPGVTVKDLLHRGVSLRCWDQRSAEHRWHPLFVAGQGWPSERPLEVGLACSRDGQSELELVLGEPSDEKRREVVFENGLPQLRLRPAGEARVCPWAQQPAPLPLQPPGRRGEDRLRLRFQIDSSGELLLEGDDLSSGAALARRRLGPVR